MWTCLNIQLQKEIAKCEYVKRTTLHNNAFKNKKKKMVIDERYKPN